MKRVTLGLPQLLYYGEVVGVLLAWAVGIAVVLAAGESERPTAETERLANASSPSIGIE